MRFEIGQQVPFIKVKFHSKPDFMYSFQSLFDPRVHELDSIEVKMLTVKEHHKVPSCYEPDGEKKYDGFIFVEQIDIDKQQMWHNQYPTATYGQLSDTNDRMVFRHTSHTKEQINEMSHTELDMWTERWWTALDSIAAIKRAIDGGDIYSIHLSSEDRVLFEDYLSKVQEVIEKVSGKSIIFTNATINLKDGSVKELNGYWVAELI